MPYYDVRYDPDEGKVVAVLVDENGRSKVSMASIYHRDVVGNLVPNAPNPVNVSGSAGGSSGGGVGNIIFPTTSMPNNPLDRKSTRLNSSHQIISYAVFCLKKKKKTK